ncbi:MAG: hypothetical protein ACI4YB_11335 [Oscillospiraceae bacterium]
MKKNVKSVFASIMAVCCIVSNSVVFASADFVTEGETTKYEDSNGEFVKKQLITVDGKKYYFDEDGNMCTGFVTVQNATYYFDEKGVMQTGLKKIDGTYYYFSEKGKMATGTVVVNKKNIYRFNSDGKFKNKADGWVKFKSGSTYYCVKGKIQKGIVTVKNSDGSKVKYYFDEDGKLVTGKNVEYNLSILYINSDGEIYKTKDNSQKKRNEIKKLEEKIEAYNKDIEDYEDSIEYYKEEQSDAKRMMDYYEKEIKRLKDFLKNVDRGKDSMNFYKEDYDLASNKDFLKHRTEHYDYYTKKIKEMQIKINACKAEIKKLYKQISDIESELKKAGLKV